MPKENDKKKNNTKNTYTEAVVEAYMNKYDCTYKEAEMLDIMYGDDIMFE